MSNPEEAHTLSAEYIERNETLQQALARRSVIQIKESGQPLLRLPEELFSFASPHPYFSLGAPYGGADPFCVREEVHARLCRAAQDLAARHPGFRLHIYDAYRPIAVQEFMIEHERMRISRARGWDPAQLSDAQHAQVMQDVFSVWAKPSGDSALPTPHSTGGAVDVTIIDSNDKPLEMGSGFDDACPEILPNAFRERAPHDAQARVYHQNRELLCSVMHGAGLLRITHEWWHFSYGDQMWALLHSLQTHKACCALYGAV